MDIQIVIICVVIYPMACGLAAWWIWEALKVEVQSSWKSKGNPGTTWSIPRLGSVVRITPIYKPWIKRPFGRGPTTRSLGNLWVPWVLNHLQYKSWDDPPSNAMPPNEIAGLIKELNYETNHCPPFHRQKDQSWFVEALFLFLPHSWKLGNGFPQGLFPLQ